MRQRKSSFQTYSPEQLEKIKNNFRASIYYDAAFEDSHQQECNQAFQKIKNMFFEEHLEGQYIVSLIKSNPLAYFTKAALLIIQHYQHKGQTVKKQNQEESKHYQSQIHTLKEQITHYINLTESLKDEINQLQNQKINVQVKLNESYSNLDQTQSCRESLYVERKNLQQVNLNISRDCNRLKRENQRLNHYIDQLQRKIIQLDALKEEVSYLRTQNQQLESACNQAVQKIMELNEELQISKHKYNQKAQLYQRMVEEFNFKQRSSICQFSSPSVSRQGFADGRGKQKDDLQRSNELNGLIFNLTDSQEIKSKASHLSIGQNIQIIDYGNTPIQLSKSPSCGINRPSTQKQQKSSAQVASVKKCVKLQQVTTKKQEMNMSKQKSFQKSQMLSQSKPMPIHAKQGNKVSQFNASSGKKVNSLAKNQNTPNNKAYIQSTLKQKLNEKNILIEKLENELQAIRSMCFTQKANFSIIEGEYEIKLCELKDFLAYTKKQMKILFVKYCSNKALCESYQLRNIELQSQIKTLKSQYQQYCSFMKVKCKQYILNSLASIEQDYQEILDLYNATKAQIQRNNSIQVQKEEQKEEKDHLLLNSDQKEEEKACSSQDKYKEESLSVDQQKMKNIVKENKTTCQILVYDNLQLQSQFSFKLSFQDHLKGNFTQRTSKTQSNFHQTEHRPEIIKIRKLAIHNIFSQQYKVQKSIVWKICTLENVSIRKKPFRFDQKQVEIKLQVIKQKNKDKKICFLQKISISSKKISMNQREIEIQIKPKAEKVKSITQTLSYQIKPPFNPQKMELLSLFSLQMEFLQPKRQKSINTFEIIKIENQKKQQLSTVSYNLFKFIPIKTILSFAKTITFQALLKRIKPLFRAQYLKKLSFSAENSQQTDESVEKYCRIINETVDDISSNMLNISIEIEQDCLNRQTAAFLEKIISQYRIQMQNKNKQNVNSLNRKQYKKLKHKACQSNQMQACDFEKEAIEQSDEYLIDALQKLQSIDSLHDAQNNLKKRQESNEEDKENSNPNCSLIANDKRQNNSITVQSTVILVKSAQSIQNESESLQKSKIQPNLREVPTICLQNKLEKQKKRHKFKNYELVYNQLIDQGFITIEQAYFLQRYLPGSIYGVAIQKKYDQVYQIFQENRNTIANAFLLFMGQEKKNGQPKEKFLITCSFLLNLNNKKDILFRDCNRYFNRLNFMYGMDQVRLRTTGILEIKRGTKPWQMGGSHPDGHYPIGQYYKLRIEGLRLPYIDF